MSCPFLIESEKPKWIKSAGREKDHMAKANATSSNLEATLWAAADKLRGTLDAAEYKHVVLGLIFLKYISDAFEERRAELDRLSRDKDSDLYVKDDQQRDRLLEDKDEYAAVNVFWV